MPGARSLLSFGLCLLLAVGAARAQDNRLVNTHDPLYGLVQNLQQRGHLLGLTPTDLPHTTGELRAAVRRIDTTALRGPERRWLRTLRAALPSSAPNVAAGTSNDDSLRVGGTATIGVRRSSSARLSVIDPKGEAEPALPRARLTGYLEWGPWIGQAGATADWFYETDPDGLDLARRLYARSEEVYLGYNGPRAQVYLGRFDNQWAPYDRRGGLLTDNPRAFDQVQFRLGGSTLSFQSLLGTLDNMGPDSTYTGRSFGQGATRRYLFLHRLDWRPTDNLTITAMEGEIYHSTTAGIALRNLIPLHTIFLESANKPRNNDSNAVLGGSIWYQPGPVTLHVQGTLDDILVSRREERKRSGEFYPAVYTVTSSVTWAGVTPRLDLGAEVDVISTNAYRTDNRADEWSYAQRGLATNLSDYVRTEAHATWYPGWAPGLEVEPTLTFYWKGEGDFRRLRTTYAPGPGGAIPHVLSGTNERTIRPALRLRYQTLSTPLFGPSGDARVRLWASADLGTNIVANEGNVRAATDRRFVGLLRISGQLSL